MDRLICGDVGFGKTEVAIRAAFKAVMNGKQVAVLAPTTVLAQQHFETFRQRMLDYPIQIEMLSRFRSPGEQKKMSAIIARGRRRHCHRNASAHFRRRIFQRSRPGSDRRRTALWGPAQGKIQGTVQTGRCSHPFGHSDPAHSLSLVSRCERHVDNRNATAKPASGRNSRLWLR